MSRSEPVKFGAKTRTVDLSPFWNWPKARRRGSFWQELAERVRKFPTGTQKAWGIPFVMADGRAKVILTTQGGQAIIVPLRARATHLCLLHEWAQIPETVRHEEPREGILVGEYVLKYRDGTSHTQPVRARFEVAMKESPGPAWLAVSFNMPAAADPIKPPGENAWGRLQHGIGPMENAWKGPAPLLYVLTNPYPEKMLNALLIRGLQDSPLLVAGLTLYEGTDNPLRHLPRRTYRLRTAGGPAIVSKAEADVGVVTRIERTSGPRNRRWLTSPAAGVNVAENGGEEDVIEVVASQDATLSVELAGRARPLHFSVGQAYHTGKDAAGGVELAVLGRERQWMQVTVIDRSTGKPTPSRIHFSGSRGEYLPPYGHHAQVNTNWFEDYGADVVVGDRSYAYVPGQFTSDLPVGEVYVEINKGFEYQPLRQLVTIQPGQKALKLYVDRWKDLRGEGWVTADTHVHFVSPHTAWLEAQAEGVNVVNLLASQWGRLFTNVGDVIGRPNIVQDDTIVFVGTENRNHMLGHMSMLGTQGLSVYPMCCGGVWEAWFGDPDFRTLTEWATENRRKRGVNIRPHYPFCGHTEDPVAIIKGVVDALEINGPRGDRFPTQEWYRYLNCGYRVAVCGGTDKMSARTAIGATRTYAKLDPNRAFTYSAWAAAVRAGRTFSTNGPLIDMQLEGAQLGETLQLPPGGGTLAASAIAECFAPLGALEIVVNGRVVASAKSARGESRLCIRDKVKIASSGWIGARCTAHPKHPGNYMAAHTSPIYVRCGDERAFDGPAAEHMLKLVEGGIEYLNNVATVFDDRARRRMVRVYEDTKRELGSRLAEAHNHATRHGHTH
jgi:hypothetical protein